MSAASKFENGVQEGLFNLLHAMPAAGTGLLETCHSDALLILKDEGRREICTKRRKHSPAYTASQDLEKPTVSDLLTKSTFFSFLFVRLKRFSVVFIQWHY
jgi:hypothetical protein